MKEPFTPSTISSPLEKLYLRVMRFYHSTVPLGVIPHLAQEIGTKGMQGADPNILNICSPNLFSQPGFLALLALSSFSL